jgi:hypothetical protein
VLGLREPLDPDLELEAREQGTLFHALLADFFRTHPWLPPGLDAARALAQRFLETARERLGGEIPAKDPSFLTLTWTRVARALDELVVVEHEEQARLAADGLAVERRLEEPLEFVLPDPAGGPGLRLGGRPDRIEVHRRGRAVVHVRVLDYKTTRDGSRFRALLDPAGDLGRTSVQIPVYLLGALAPPGIEGVSEATTFEGGFVALLAEKKWHVREIPAALLEPGPARAGEPPTFAERIRDLVARAGAGRFDVNPSPCDPYCAFRGVCRFQPLPLEDEDGDG